MIEKVLEKLRKLEPDSMYVISEDMVRFYVYDKEKKIADGGMELISLPKHEGKPSILCMKDKSLGLYFCIQFNEDGMELEGGDFIISD